MSTSTHASATIHNDAEVHLTDSSIGVSYDNSIEASVGASVSTDYASAGVEVSVKTGTVASAEAGLDGNNVYCNVSYSDTTEAHIKAEAEVGYAGVGCGAAADAYVKQGTEAEMHIAAGQNGIAAGGSASIGTAVGVDAEATVGLREASATAGAGVSVGEHFEIGGGGQATFRDGKATVGVEGEVAALIGVEADISVTVDTRQIQKDAVVVAEGAQVAADQTAKVADQATAQAAKVAEKTGNAITRGAKDLGKKMKKAFRF